MDIIHASAEGRHDKASRVRVPKQNRAVRAKQAILQAAMDLFSAKGFHQTNSKEIAALAGVSIGSFYSYYPDKRELFKDAVQLYCCRFNETLYAMLDRFDLNARGDARKTVLRSFIDSLIAAHKIYEGFHNELIVMYLSDPEMHAIVTEKHAESRANVALYLERAKDRLTVTDLEAAAAVLYDMVHSVVDTVVFQKTNLDRERILNSLVEAMDRYLFC